MGTSRSELRKTIAGCRKNSRGRRSYGAELRREVVSFIDAAVRKGGNFERECQSLGIDSTVVRRWRKAERSPGFEAVRVVGTAGENQRRKGKAKAPGARRGREEPTSALSLVSPSGWRVEGLDLDGVARLLAGLP